MSDEGEQPNGVRNLTGASSDEVFAFLFATTKDKDFVPLRANSTHTPLVDEETQKEVIGMLPFLTIVIIGTFIMLWEKIKGE